MSDRNQQPETAAWPVQEFTIEKNPNDSRDTYFKFLTRVVVTSKLDGGTFYSVLFVNKGETCTSTTAKHQTLKGAENWARKLLFQQRGEPQPKYQDRITPEGHADEIPAASETAGATPEDSLEVPRHFYENTWPVEESEAAPEAPQSADKSQKLPSEGNAPRVMKQDDGKREYTCDPTWCGYDGNKTCQNCGFAQAENYTLVTPSNVHLVFPSEGRIQ